MRHSGKLLIILSILFSIFSCKPIYRCGEAKPEKKLFIPKFVQAVVDERDSLCSTLTVRDSQIGDLKDLVDKKDSTITQKNADIKKLNKKYSDLTNANLTQNEQFNLELTKKSDELKRKSDDILAKEKLLKDRENSLNEMKKVIARQDSITKRLNNILKDALLSFKSDELSVEVRDGKVYVSMSDKLLFQSGSAAVESKGLEAIKVLADVLDKNKNIDILVEGHTDNVPIKTAQYKDNWDLSVARATSIVRILTSDYKIAPTRLTASGKGEFAPRASNATPEGRAKNRRTDIILSPKLDEIMKLIKAN